MQRFNNMPNWTPLCLPLLEAGSVYEVKLVAYNGNGESDSSNRLVSLAEESAHSTGNFYLNPLSTMSTLTCNSNIVHRAELNPPLPFIARSQFGYAVVSWRDWLELIVVVLLFTLFSSCSPWNAPSDDLNSVTAQCVTGFRFQDILQVIQGNRYVCVKWLTLQALSPLPQGGSCPVSAETARGPWAASSWASTSPWPASSSASSSSCSDTVEGEKPWWYFTIGVQ